LLDDVRVALAGIIVIPPLLSLLPLLMARRSDGSYDAAKWAGYIGLFRVVPILAVATWWSVCDIFPGSLSLLTSRHVFPRSVCFWVPPMVSMAVARLIVYWSRREVLKQRWTNVDILRLATWSTLARTLPLLMVAIGIDGLPFRIFAGLSCIAGAAAVALFATVRLRTAEGFEPRPVNSGELHKRAFLIAKKMGVRLRSVYVVPSGKGHFTNAFGSLSRSIGVTDDYGKWLKGSQLDFVVGHELAHIQQKHWQKKMTSLALLFSLISMLGIGLPHLPTAVRAVFPFVAVFVPLLIFYGLSRRFEYAADRAGVEAAKDPGASIQALAGLYRRTQESPESSPFAELFATHPPLSRRVEAIARSHQLTTERISHLVRNVF
jgi:Zn-dependent protease with chaperone function